jgi:hypothetical protein
VLKVLDPSSLTDEDRQHVDKAHPKSGFPHEKPSWKVVAKRRLLNGAFFVGIAAGFLLAMNQVISVEI